MTALDFNAMPVETIVDLKGRVDIADFVSRYVKLKRSGADYGGLCPFHAERTPSFQVSPRWQNFKCWGCGVAGDVIDFVGALENLRPGEAIGRFRELVGGAALDPAAVAAQAARLRLAAGGTGCRPQHRPGAPHLERGGIPDPPL